MSEYKNRLFVRTARRCLTLSAALALLPLLLSIFWPWLKVLGLLALLPVFYMAVRMYHIAGFAETIGTIRNVRLLDPTGDPYTVADIVFNSGQSGHTHTAVCTLRHYGDYTEGCEPELEKMLDEDRQYIGCQVPVLYQKNNPGTSIVYPEDIQKNN